MKTKRFTALFVMLLIGMAMVFGADSANKTGGTIPGAPGDTSTTQLELTLTADQVVKYAIGFTADPTGSNSWKTTFTGDIATGLPAFKNKISLTYDNTSGKASNSADAAYLFFKEIGKQLFDLKLSGKALQCNGKTAIGYTITIANDGGTAFGTGKLVVPDTATSEAISITYQPTDWTSDASGIAGAHQLTIETDYIPADGDGTYTADLTLTIVAR